MKDKKYSAFTLLELLIVLTIIGILMLIGMAGIPRLIDTANTKAVQTEMGSFRVAILNYKIDMGVAPTGLSDLLDNGYITQELAKDPWNVNYMINIGEDTRSVVVRSAGPDKEANTDDDLTETIDMGW